MPFRIARCRAAFVPGNGPQVKLDRLYGGLGLNHIPVPYADAMSPEARRPSDVSWSPPNARGCQPRSERVMQVVSAQWHRGEYGVPWPTWDGAGFRCLRESDLTASACRRHGHGAPFLTHDRPETFCPIP